MKPTTLPESILSIRKPTIDTDSMQGKESHYSSHASIRSQSTREKSYRSLSFPWFPSIPSPAPGHEASPRVPSPLLLLIAALNVMEKRRCNPWGTILRPKKGNKINQDFLPTRIGGSYPSEGRICSKAENHGYTGCFQLQLMMRRRNISR